MGDHIPIIDWANMSKVQGAPTKRLEQFTTSFKGATGLAGPEFIVRAPGRINLIGDHVDYHGFSVLPMAIDNSVLVGVSFQEVAKTIETVNKPNGVANLNHIESGDHRAHVTILNIDPETYPTFQCEHSFKHGAKLDQSHRWHHYILCGYHGVLARELLAIEASQIHSHSKSLGGVSGDCRDHESRHLSSLPPLTLFIDSSLPPASGLSSSSALVCASALATKLLLSCRCECNVPTQKIGHHEINSRRLAEECAKFEHLVGTAGGGMDQAVILTAQEGYAKHIEFLPAFKCDNVRLPEGVVWLVSHCGHECAKAATLGFNSRVLETKLAAALIVKTLDPDQRHAIPLDSTITLGRVVRELFGHDHRPLNEILEHSILAQHNNVVLRDMPLDELCNKLDMSRQELVSKFATSEEFLARSQMDAQLRLLARCRHVLEEAHRVEQFRQVCQTTTGECDVHQLGALMSASHASLRDQYECSHASLDRLVEISLAAGALGARLTGAGWGGCVVTLVEAQRADQVQAELERVSRFTFRTEPKSGASIVRLGSV